MKIVEELDISTGTTERFLLVNFLGQEARFKANDGVIEAVMARSVAGAPQPAAPPEPGRPSELEDWAAEPPAPPPAPKSLHEAFDGPPHPPSRPRTIQADARGNPIVPPEHRVDGSGGVMERDDEEGTVSI
jgi:hypothetical protein